MAVDPGVQAPTGDPGQVAAAAGWHDRLAGFFDQTATHVEYTLGSWLGANWSGEAASSYGQLGLLVAAHFRHAGSVAQSAAQTLRRYAQQLEQFQREGQQAVQQTVHWLEQLQRDQAKLTQAQHDVANAQSAVNSATAALNRAATSPMPGGAVAHLGHDLTAAQGRLTQAQTAVRLAQRAVDDDEHQVQHWQQRARQIWQEAQNAAAVATGSLEPLSVAPPPLAGAPATFTDALAADAPFLASHLQLSQALAQQIAQRNADHNHLGHAAVSTDEQHVLTALEHGQNLDGVPLSQPHHGGGGFWSDVLNGAVTVLAVGGTEILGGGPEDPAADGASAAEVAAIDGGGGAASAAVSAGSEATAATDATAVADAGMGEAFHYTASQYATSIEENGLRPGAYATPNGELSPLQAQIELSLPPNRALPDLRVTIDLAGLRRAGYEIPRVTRVSNVVRGGYGRVYSMPGGGYEMQFPYSIPSEFIKVQP